MCHVQFFGNNEDIVIYYLCKDKKVSYGWYNNTQSKYHMIYCFINGRSS